MPSCERWELSEAIGIEQGGGFLDSLLSTVPRQRDQLIPLLQKVQTRFGYVPEWAIVKIARALKLSPDEVFGVVTFYAQFSLVPKGRHCIKVCQGTACHVRGAKQIMDAVKDELAVEPGSTTADGEYSVERIACFGACSLAPVAVIDQDVFGRLTSDKIRKIIRGNGRKKAGEQDADAKEKVNS